MIALDLCQGNYQTLLILSEKNHSDKYTDCKSRLDYLATKDDQSIFRCFDRKNNYQKDFHKDLINRFGNIYQFCNENINKFVLLFKKCLCI